LISKQLLGVKFPHLTSIPLEQTAKTMNYKGYEITTEQIKQGFVFSQPTYWIVYIDGRKLQNQFDSEEEAIAYAKFSID
jgi:hypothetical protein